MPPLSYIGLLVSAPQATSDPEGCAKALLSGMVDSGEYEEEMEAFAPFVRGKAELHLVGAEAAPRMGQDSPVVSLDGSDAVAAGCCWTGARSSRRARPGIFERSGGGQSSRANAESIHPWAGRATARPPVNDGVAGQSSCARTGPHRRGAGMTLAPLDSHRVESRGQPAGISAVEAAGGLAGACVAAGMASETFLEAAGV